MAHEQQERYSSLVLAKIRKENKLKNGVVFNTDYEGIGIQSGCTNVYCSLSANSVQGIPAQADLYRTVKALSEAFQSD